MDFAQNLKFGCVQCRNCCCLENGVVILSRTDLELLAEWSGLTPEQFQKVYCRILEDDRGKKFLCLRDKFGNECIFWEDEKCSCYESRPVQCRTYPFWTKILADENSWLAEKKFCPGINQGKIFSMDEINENLKRYEENKKSAGEFSCSKNSF
jgi:hypothetical protein